MTLPIGARVAAGAGVALLLLPLLGLVARVHWATFWTICSPGARDALLLSVVTALAATIAVILGVPLALVLARAQARPAAVLRTLVLIPLVLPPMVGGLALLSLLGRSASSASRCSRRTGFSLPYTTAAVVVAQAFVALPFLVITLEGALRTSGVAHERVAASLGASPWRVVTRVTLPLLLPGLVAGTALCFARAIGEFGATALFAGNAVGVTRTMPLAIYTASNGVGVSQDAALALSLLLLVSAGILIAGLRSWREDAVR